MRDDGFTLIELVITMILVGILAAVAVPRFWDLINPSKENVTKHRMEEIRKAVVGNPDAVSAGTYSARGFRGDTGSFPNTRDDLICQGGYANWNKYTRSGWNGPYIDSSGCTACPPPLTGCSSFLDAWGNPFVYAPPPANPPTITSYGINGISGGGDDIVVELRY